MKNSLLAAAMMMAVGCSTTTTVKGTLLVDAGGARPEEFAYEATETHSTTGLAGLCATTWWLYGGAVGRISHSLSMTMRRWRLTTPTSTSPGSVGVLH